MDISLKLRQWVASSEVIKTYRILQNKKADNLETASLDYANAKAELLKILIEMSSSLSNNDSCCQILDEEYTSKDNDTVYIIVPS